MGPFRTFVPPAKSIASLRVLDFSRINSPEKFTLPISATLINLRFKLDLIAEDIYLLLGIKFFDIEILSQL